MGHSAQSKILDQEEFLAQEVTIVLDVGVGPDGIGSVKRALGPLTCGMTSSSQPNLLGGGMEGQPLSQREAEVIAEGENNAVLEIPVDLVRCSQLPSINLVVDLKDAGCRRRRRRQLSNLATISENVDRNPDLEVSSSSTELEEVMQTNPDVAREVLATMAVGGELGIIFRPNDDLILRKMIEIDSQEYSHDCERVSGG